MRDLLYTENGYLTFLHHVGKEGKTICDKLNLSLIADEVILRECYESAADSINFHGEEGGQANHIKQAAHCCFWIAKLKPIQSPVPFWDFAVQFNPDLKASTDPDLRVYQSKQLATFPFNEALALAVGNSIVVDGYDDIAEGYRKKRNYAKRRDLNKKITELSKILPEVSKIFIKSLRLNNHSARSLATTFEFYYTTNHI